MTTVACVGIAVMDYLFTVDALPAGDGKVYASRFEEVGGGVAANAAYAVARLGGAAQYFGRVGDDSTGQRIVGELKAAGVDTSQVRAIPGLASPVSAVLVDSSGERLIVNHTDSRLFEGGDLEHVGAAAEADCVLVDVRWPAAAAVALKRARERSIPSVFDFDRPMDDRGGELLAAASHVAFSAAALAATAGTDDPAAALRAVSSRTEAFLAVTLGADGVMWLDGPEVHHVSPPAVAVVDTVGAGDVFHGAFALTLGEGQAESDAIRFASAAAAIKCSRPGGRSGAPGRAEVEVLLKEWG